MLLHGELPRQELRPFRAPRRGGDGLPPLVRDTLRATCRPVAVPMDAFVPH
ncbi:MAG: hypothetical protein U0793_03735 [Gemmataceae bacterium]